MFIGQRKMNKKPDFDPPYKCERRMFLQASSLFLFSNTQLSSAIGKMEERLYLDDGVFVVINGWVLPADKFKSDLT